VNAWLSLCVQKPGEGVMTATSIARAAVDKLDIYPENRCKTTTTLCKTTTLNYS
jgi:hypothetical protein